MFQFFRKRNDSFRDSAADLQFALLQEAERNIYGDTAIYTKKHSAPLANDRWRPKKSSVYSNIFEPQMSMNSHEFESAGDSRATGDSLFPALDFCLYFAPMWITRDRRFSCINIIGLCISFLVAAVYSFDAFTGGTVSGLDADNLEKIGGVYRVILVGNAIWIPTQFCCQLVFHAKYFKIFWTDDKRDNRMIYFIAEKDRSTMIHRTMFLYLFIKLSLAVVYTLAAYSDFTRDYVYSDFIFKGKWGFFGWQIGKFVFFYIPRSLHGIVIFLYCLEWKFRIRYFWKCKLIEYLHESSLIRHYKKMMNLMEYQLFWIKGWMAADFLAISAAIWYWLWVWLQYDTLDTETTLSKLIVQGMGYLCYHSMGFLLTWFTAASVTAEAHELYECAVTILEKLNEQEFAAIFTMDEDHDKLVDYSQIDLNAKDNENILGYADSGSAFGGGMRARSKSKNGGKGMVPKGSMDAMDHENAWKALMNNKEIMWEEWIYINNVEVNGIKDEMKRACLIKQLHSFILYYNKKPCVFQLGLTVRYSNLFKIVLVFFVAKLADYLWSFN